MDTEVAEWSAEPVPEPPAAWAAADTTGTPPAEVFVAVQADGTERPDGGSITNGIVPVVAAIVSGAERPDGWVQSG